MAQKLQAQSAIDKNFFIKVGRIGHGVKCMAQIHLDTSPKSEPALELNSRAAPSVEAHHRVNGQNTGRISGGRWIKKNLKI